MIFSPQLCACLSPKIQIKYNKYPQSKICCKFQLTYILNRLGAIRKQRGAVSRYIIGTLMWSLIFFFLTYFDLTCFIYIFEHSDTSAASLKANSQHSSLTTHFSVSSVWSWQSEPSSGYCLTYRSLDLIPIPQETLQADQLIHSDIMHVEGSVDQDKEQILLKVHDIFFSLHLTKRNVCEMTEHTDFSELRDSNKSE